MTDAEFLFHPKVDSCDYDIRFVGRKPLNELLDLARKDLFCVGFNTLGFMKYYIPHGVPLAPCKYYEDTNTEGLYIHKERHKRNLTKYPPKSNYRVYPFRDSVSNDIKHYPGKSLDELIRLADNNAQCLAFNTLGYLKSVVKPMDKLDYLKPPHIGALYVKIKVTGERKVVIPDYTMSMSSIEGLLKLWSSGQPVVFAAFSKELIDFLKTNPSSPLVTIYSDLLGMAMKGPTQFVGLPCKECCKTDYKALWSILDTDVETTSSKATIVPAALLHNSNLTQVWTTLIKTKLNIVLVCNEGDAIDQLPFSPSLTFTTVGFESNPRYVYEEFKTKYKLLPKTLTVVLFAVDWLGAALAIEWSQHRPEHLYLDLSTLLNPILRHKVLPYHVNLAPHCVICNPQESLDIPKALTEWKGKSQADDRGFQLWEALIKPDSKETEYKQLAKLYAYTAQSPDRNIAYYSQWMRGRCLHKLQVDLKLVEEAYLQTRQVDPNRAEALYELMGLVDETKKFEYAQIITQMPPMALKPTIAYDPSIYDWKALDVIATLAGKLNRPQEGLKACRLAIKERRGGELQQECFKRNLDFYLNQCKAQVKG